MKFKLTLILSSFLIISFFIASSFLLNRQILENDEGIYWTTFLLADKGYTLYKEISFSQLPGFFIATYSFFKLFESTIAGTRFGVVYWVILALISIVWLGHVRKNLLFSLSSIVLFIGIPVFLNQSLTLQSDSVAVAFSTISFVFMITYSVKTKKLDSHFPTSLSELRGTGRGNDKQGKIWLVLAAIFFSLALLTKFDYSLALPFGYLLLTEKKDKIKKIFLFSAVSIVVIFLILNFFGLQSVVGSVITLREKALDIYQFDLGRFLKLLKSELLLSLVIFGNILFSIFKWKKDKFSLSIFLWFISSLFLVLSFRPILQHHLVFLVVPAILLLVNYFSGTKNTINRLIVFLIIFSSLISFVKNYRQMSKRQNSRLIKEREIAKNFILKYSKPGDLIITDEAALYGMTERLPPPELVDISEVQVLSGNVSPEKFKKAMADYEPKLVIVWNGRINPLKTVLDFDSNYKIIEVYKGKRIYLRD